MELPSKTTILAAAVVTAVVSAALTYWLLRPRKVEKAVVPDLEGADPAQRAMMAERCILVDDDDRPLRPVTKAECHQWASIGSAGTRAHRAFSVFMFDLDGRLVLQQRSDEKITFPGYWANTCCSHPLWTPEEMELEGATGVKRAARRKLEQELGVEPSSLPEECFHWVGRVHYRAPSDDGVWGEHEIDHVLIALPDADVPMRPNPNEVQATKAFAQADLAAWLDAAPAKGTKVSPWFSVIRSEMLPAWWGAVRRVRSKQARGEAVDVAAELASVKFDTILRVGDPTASASAAAAAAVAAGAAASPPRPAPALA